MTHIRRQAGGRNGKRQPVLRQVGRWGENSHRGRRNHGYRRDAEEVARLQRLKRGNAESQATSTLLGEAEAAAHGVVLYEGALGARSDFPRTIWAHEKRTLTIERTDAAE